MKSKFYSHSKIRWVSLVFSFVFLLSSLSLFSFSAVASDSFVNLYDPSKATKNGYVNANGSFASNNNYLATDFIPVTPGETLYIGPMDVEQYIMGAVFDSSKQAKAGLSQNHTPSNKSFTDLFEIHDIYHMLAYTVPSGISYIRLDFHQLGDNLIYISRGERPTLESYSKAVGIDIPAPDKTSPLCGKKALFLGDSIAYGAGDNGIFGPSWASRIALSTGLTAVNKAVSGCYISHTPNDYGFISDELNGAGSGYDFIVLHGGVNDARASVKVGEMLYDWEGDDYDLSTFAGGLEFTLSKMQKLYPHADYFYITNFHLDSHNRGRAQDMSAYFDVAKEICEKWNVTVIDLYNNEELNKKLEPLTTKYLPDNLHPNSAGHDIIAPYIRKDLEDYYRDSISFRLNGQSEKIGFAMVDGASIRVSEPTGMRFKTGIDKKAFDEMISFKGIESVTIGTLILPVDNLGKTEFTKEALDKAKKDYLDIKATVGSWYESDENAYTFAGSIVNIKETNTNRKFAARGYIEIKLQGEETPIIRYTQYIEENNARTVSEIAEAAIKDSWHYTPEQLQLIQKIVTH